MEIGSINLDFYGTLVDWLSVWTKISEKIIKDNELNADPKDFALEWRKYQRAFLEHQKYTPYKEIILNALKLMEEKYSLADNNYGEQLFSEWNNIKPFDEVNPTLNALKRKFKIGICTNSSRDLFDASVKGIKFNFDYILISDETKVNKPHLEMYQKVTKLLELKPSSVFHVASSQMDVRGARNAGFIVCWINRNHERLANNTPKPDYEINNLREILDIT